jgi:hypothetical protein
LQSSGEQAAQGNFAERRTAIVFIEGTTMLNKVTVRFVLPALLLLLNSGLAHAYDYPFKDPYAATIVGTPPEFTPPLPAEVPVKHDSILMFQDRVVSAIFWHQKELHYSYLQQQKAAPLIFLIAGTGASYQSAKMVAMQKAFYTAGYHVISISSPTRPNFIVAASTSGVPGNLIDDSRDIYSVMEAIWLKLQKAQAAHPSSTKRSGCCTRQSAIFRSRANGARTPGQVAVLRMAGCSLLQLC